MRTFINIGKNLLLALYVCAGMAALLLYLSEDAKGVTQDFLLTKILPAAAALLLIFSAKWLYHRGCFPEWLERRWEKEGDEV